MGRSILGVMVGYIVMSFLVIAALSGAYLGLGADRAFQPGSFEVTALWIFISTILSFGAALVGGALAARVGKGARAAVILAVVVVVLGVIFALPTLDAPDPGGSRTGEVGNYEAMMNAQQPAVIPFLHPIIGAVGVLLGGRVRKPGRSS